MYSTDYWTSRYPIICMSLFSLACYTPSPPGFSAKESIPASRPSSLISEQEPVDNSHDIPEDLAMPPELGLSMENPRRRFVKSQSGYGYLDMEALERGVSAIEAGGQVESIHMAAKLGRADLVERFLQEGTSVHTRDREGLTLLQMASTEEVAELLIQRGAIVNDQANFNGVSPLHRAAGRGSLAVVRLLCNHGADVNATTRWGESPIHWAGSAAVADYLLSVGAKLTQESSGVEQWLRGKTALHSAVVRRHIEVIQVLLVAGISVDVRDDFRLTPLHYAVSWGYPDVAKCLLDHGADVNAESRGRETPLHQASNRQVAEVLIRAGADIEVVARTKRTPLLSAASENRADVVSFLLSRGARVNVSDVSGATALHYAVKRGNLAMVKLLLKAGSDPSLRNRAGKTAIELAQEYSLEDIVRLLSRHAKLPGTKPAR